MNLAIISSNTKKVLQFKELFKELLPELTVLSLFDYPGYTPLQDIPETPIAERTLKKAQAAATTLKIPCLVEQWALIIPSLHHEQKAIFEQPTTTLQTQKILAALKTKSEHDRSAFFESHITVFTPQGSYKQAASRSEGIIAEKEQGKASCDFESIFIKHDYGKTLAELPPSTRQRISCRRKALERVLSFVSTLSCAT